MSSEIVGKEFRVLDDGFVRVVDVMGDDAAIVQAARVSYGAGTKKVQEDRGLIRYLMRHWHTTPFEMCEIKFHVRVPMDCWRQWIRHRTANVNEYSTRYSLAIDATQKTPPDHWRCQAKSNKQGSEGYLSHELGEKLSETEYELNERAREVYRQRLDLGVAREQARKDLPLSTYTEAYWKIDLHNLLHFLHLRMHDHAQQEIRAYADVIGERICSQWVPQCWEAFRDYRLESMQITRLDIELVKAMFARGEDHACEVAESLGWLKKSKTGGYRRNRERDEFEAKAARLGMKIPWSDGKLSM